jgi:predicted double-glycine peptidase
MLLCLAGAAIALFALARSGSAVPPVVRDSNQFIHVEPQSWKSIRQQNIVMQQYDYSCGAAALATVIRYYWGDPVTEKQFMETILKMLADNEALKDRIENGLTMTDLRRAAVKEGYLASIGKRDFVDLMDIKVPVIVRIVQGEFEHFVVFRGVNGDRVYLADPIRGNIRMTATKFIQQWNQGNLRDGVILVVAKRGAKPQTNSPLLIQPDWWNPVVPELQAARRGLYLQPFQVPQPVLVPK